MAIDTELQRQNTEPGIGTLIGGILKDAQDLIGQQLTLFKTEMENDFAKTRNAMVPLVIGLVIVLAGGLVISVGLAHLLLWAAPGLQLWGAFLIVGVLIAAAGGVASYLGYKKFTEFNPLPDKTVEALKENLTWPTKK